MIYFYLITKKDSPQSTVYTICIIFSSNLRYSLGGENMDCANCQKHLPLSELNSGNIFSRWVMVKARYGTPGYAIRAEITRATFSDIPTQNDDFRVQVEILVKFLLSDPKSEEKFERSFNARVGYDEQRQTYYLVYRVPYKRKNQGVLMNEILGFTQKFGSALPVASAFFINEAETFVRHFAKQFGIESSISISNLSEPVLEIESEPA
jgi:hypothetical protein